MEEDVDVYRWTGENYLCQLFARDKIAVGGGNHSEDDVDNDEAEGVNGSDGFGFVMDRDLKRGSSGPCRTYGNPCLVPGCDEGHSGDFDVANVEVWALTPFLFEADAERSERNIRFRQQSVAGKDTSKIFLAPSSESPLSQFL